MSLAKVGKFLVKNKAAIAFGVGTVTGVAALVETVRKSRKTVDILDEHKANIESVRKAYFIDERDKKDMPKEERKRYDSDRFKVYWNTTKKLGKNYAVAGGLAATSFFSFRYSYKTTVKLLAKAEERAAVATAAASAIAKKYDDYRQEVRDRYGDNVDFEIMNHIDEGWTEVKEGKKKLQFKTQGVLDEDLSFTFDKIHGKDFDVFNHIYNVCKVQAIINEAQARLDMHKIDGILLKDIIKDMTDLNAVGIITPVEWEVMGYEAGDQIEYDLIYDENIAKASDLRRWDDYGNRIDAPEIKVIFKHTTPVLKKIYIGDDFRGAMEDAFLELKSRMIVDAENSVEPIVEDFEVTEGE